MQSEIFTVKADNFNALEENAYYVGKGGKEVDICKFLGKGLSGKVHVGFSNDHAFAAKIFNITDEWDERWLQAELAALKKMDGSEWTPKFFGSDKLSDCCVIKMELLGDSFDKILRRNRRPFSYSLIKLFSEQLLSAVNFVHAHGLVHGDISPQNICAVTGDKPRLKIILCLCLIDFSSANTVEYLQFFGNKGIGTIPYRSPELILGLACDTKLDIWACGCVMAEFFLGSKLFNAAGRNEYFWKLMTAGLIQPPFVKSSTLINDKKLRERAKTLKTYFWSYFKTPNSCLLQKHFEDVKIYLSKKGGHGGWIAENRDLFIEQICSLLSSAPEDRPSAEEALAAITSWCAPVDA